jgi:F0F1-type ATP synthase membrane subunit c/vacuolar-type H+-ATPase subunit K
VVERRPDRSGDRDRDVVARRGVRSPELFGRLLIFVGLAEGIAIYGLIVSILILNRLA